MGIIIEKRSLRENRNIRLLMCFPTYDKEVCQYIVYALVFLLY